MNRILLINLGGIGDLLLSTPAIRGLRELYPRAEICMLASSKIYSLAASLPYIDQAFAFDIGYGGIIPLGKMFNNFFDR